jgi:hypothetical protein
MGDGILGEIEGAISGGTAQGGIEGELIQDAENLVQQKTGFDVASLLGGGQTQTTGDTSSN